VVIFYPGKNSRGFTLIEMVIVIVTLAIIATVATVRIQQTLEVARVEQTKNEMHNLIVAIAGDPRAFASRTRTDFGYVGDVGALPSDLSDLVQNPGGWSTWQGPYIESGEGGDAYLTDAWGVVYGYDGSTISSTGSGTTLTATLPPAAQLLNNNVNGVVVDADLTPPGPVFCDSIAVELVRPDGSGGIGVQTAYVTADGRFSLSGVPAGNRLLRMIYLPTSDTADYPITVYPGRAGGFDLVSPTDLW
jgi:prepilin-type N-terminal cleavage/methylation domain-containing protein